MLSSITESPNNFGQLREICSCLLLPQILEKVALMETKLWDIQYPCSFMSQEQKNAKGLILFAKKHTFAPSIKQECILLRSELMICHTQFYMILNKFHSLLYHYVSCITLLRIAPPEVIIHTCVQQSAKPEQHKSSGLLHKHLFRAFSSLHTQHLQVFGFLCYLHKFIFFLLFCSVT